jgi:tetratricopeptide (TPR) repeat protein
MDIPESIAALKKAVEIDPHAAENIASFALSALTAADYQALRSVLETHVKANPENIGTLYSLALMHMNENRLQEAKDYLARLETLAPEHLQVHYNLGLVNFRLGLEEEGRKAMERFQELKEKELADWARHNDAFRLRLQAEDAFRRKEIEESIRLYSQISAMELAEPEDLAALGASHTMLQKYAQALEFYEMALKAAPVHRDALEGASRAAEALGKTDLVRLYSRRLELISKPCI